LRICKRRSAEREISLKSGQAVLTALQRQGIAAEAFDPKTQVLEELRKYDRAVISLHGRYGEDGCIQGALEMMGIPYTGSGVMASAIAMDKWRTKCLWQLNSLPTPAFEVLNDETDLAGVANRLGLPLFIKPANEGSSIGISKVNAVDEMAAAYTLAKASDTLVLAEAAIEAGEYTVGILTTDNTLTALPVVKIEVTSEFYDYEAKYVRDDTQYICPADLPEAQARAIQEDAVKAFELIGGSGWGRVDFLMDAKGQHYFLEVNTSPGMTDHSLVPMAAQAKGISFEALVIKLLESVNVG